MRCTARVLCGLGAVAWLGGCAVDQRREVEAYRGVTDIETPPAVTAGQSLSLEQAVRLTNAYNERLAIEGENYLQSMIERQRRSASLLPTLDLFGNVNLREHTGANVSSNNNGNNSSNNRVVSFDGGFSAQYTFLTGMSDLNSVKATEADIRRRRWLLLDLREVLMLETARAYYAVLLADRLVQVLKSSEGVQQERLRDIRGRQQVGFARPLDVAQIESQASQTRVTLLDAQNSLENAWSALTFLMGTEARGLTLSDEFAPATETPSLDVMLKQAYRVRQDLLAARAAADSARSEVDASIGAYYPSVRINLEYFLTRQSSPEDLNLTSLIAINLPLFSAGRIEADVREDWSLFRQRVLEYSLLRRQIQRDVETANADLVVSRQRVVELDAQVKASAEALRQAEAAYAAGLGTNLERVTAQDLLLAAQLRQAREQFTLKIAALALLRAQGGLTQDLTAAVGPEPTPEELTPPDSPFIRTGPAAAEPPDPLPTSRPAR